MGRKRIIRRCFNEMPHNIRMHLTGFSGLRRFRRQVVRGVRRRRFEVCIILHPLQALLLVVLFACASVCLGGAPQDEEDATSQREREALLSFLRRNGVELRAAEKKSNVISHVYSVGPEHEKRYLVGLTYHPRPLRHADVTAHYPIALPFVVNNHWVLWQVGGPRGNATNDYLMVWARVRNAFKAYSS